MPPSITDDAIARLVRIETRMDALFSEIDKLAARDLEQARTMTEIADKFAKSLKEIAEQFVKKEEWAFWKQLLTLGLLALIGLGWTSLQRGNLPHP